VYCKSGQQIGASICGYYICNPNDLPDGGPTHFAQTFKAIYGCSADHAADMYLLAAQKARRLTDVVHP